MRDRENAEEWVAPDQESLYNITLAVASDLAKGVDKKTIAKGLVTHDGWLEEAAIGFIDQVEEERAEHEPQEQNAPGTSSLRVASRLAMGAIALGLVVLSLGALDWAKAGDAECEARHGSLCGILEVLTFYFVALPAWIIAGLFALGAILPSGNFRRLVTASAAGLPVGIVILFACASFARVVTLDWPANMLVASIPAIAGFCMVFDIAYRLADHG